MAGTSPHRPQEGKTTKAIQRHAHSLYAALASEATKDGKLLVFRGSTSTVFTSLGISQGYYTETFKILEHNGCIEQLQRGSRGIDTVLLLLSCPDDPSALELPDKPVPPADPLTGNKDYAKLVARVEALEILVGGLDIAGVLLNYENRITALEKKRGATHGKSS